MCLSPNFRPCFESVLATVRVSVSRSVSGLRVCVSVGLSMAASLFIRVVSDSVRFLVGGVMDEFVGSVHEKLQNETLTFRYVNHLRRTSLQQCMTSFCKHDCNNLELTCHFRHCFRQ